MATMKLDEMVTVSDGGHFERGLDEAIATLTGFELVVEVAITTKYLAAAKKCHDALTAAVRAANDIVWTSDIMDEAVQAARTYRDALDAQELVARRRVDLLEWRIQAMQYHAMEQVARAERIAAFVAEHGGTAEMAAATLAAEDAARAAERKAAQEKEAAERAKRKERREARKARSLGTTPGYGAESA